MHPTNQKNRSVGRASLGRKVALVLAGALCLTAAIAIWALSRGGLDATAARALASTFAASLCTLAGLVAATVLDRSDHRRTLGQATMLLSGLDLALALAALWSRPVSEPVVRALGVTSVLLLASVHACLILGRLRPVDSGAVRLVSQLAVGFATAAAVAVVGAILFATGPIDPVLWRLLGVLLVLAVLATLLAPIARRVTRRDEGAREHPSPPEARMRPGSTAPPPRREPPTGSLIAGGPVASRRGAQMARHRKRVLALAGVVLVVGGALTAYAAGTAGGIRLDDRQRDGTVCGTGDEDNQCDGAENVTIVPNPGRREYALIWEGWYTGGMQDGVRLYGRRVDARTGQPKGPSVELAQTGYQYPFAATYDPATRTYVVAWQPPTEPGGSVHQIQVQRFDESLQPSGVAQTLAGNWDLKAITTETDGRVAVIGAEHEQAVNWPTTPGIGSLRLHVETIDARNRTVSVATRDAGAAGFAEGVAATYSPSARSLLVAWIPAIAQQGADSIRVDQFDASAAGGTDTLPITPGVPIWQTNLVCNKWRGDCLLLYAGGGPTLADLHARLLGPNGQPRGGDVTVAAGTRGPIGAGPTGDGYTFAWNQDGVTPPNGTHVIAARLTGSVPEIKRILDRMPSGQAQFAATDALNAGLLVWRSPVDHPTWFQIRGEIVR